MNRQRYLRQVLECIAHHPIDRVDELLSWTGASIWTDDASAKDLPLVKSKLGGRWSNGRTHI
ncbi:MAG: transposase domain-containing protein [Curvibacter lanceolatus]|uniref:hypothetical protein n=1 Tax=Curvibacter lanceolatus TaxID=86182 RepID=UPI0012F75856|nr:transposase domain-containing protein [Curvibacter lanceolatus]